MSKVDKSKNDSCIDFSYDLIRLSESLAQCKSELLKSQIEHIPTTIITGKVKKSFNIDNSEIVKLRNSLFAKSDSLALINADNLALKSKVKNLERIKNSTTGNNSPNSVKSGNTTKKISWWWIFLSGGLTWFVLQNVVFKTLKIYLPFLKFLP